jgi:hypothetical protein
MLISCARQRLPPRIFSAGRAGEGLIWQSIIKFLCVLTLK